MPDNSSLCKSIRLHAIAEKRRRCLFRCSGPLRAFPRLSGHGDEAVGVVLAFGVVNAGIGPMEAQQLDPVLAARSRSALRLAIISLRVMVGTYPTQHQHQDGRDLSRDGPAQAQPRHDGRPDPLCDPQQHRGAQADIRNPNSVATATRVDPARRVVSGVAKRGSSARDRARRDPMTRQSPTMARHSPAPGSRHL